MNKKLLIVSALILPMLVINKTIISTPTGAADGHTGSPADGQTCFTSGCHVGAPTTVTNILTSNVPTEGYTPNTSYTITVTLTGSGSKGFQVSPQKTDGTLLGSLTAGTGDVNFYGAFAITRSATKTQVLNIKEKAGTGIKEEKEFSTSVYPNPVSDQLQMTFNNLVKKAVITLYDINGKEISYQIIEDSYGTIINVSEIAAGNYFVKLVADNKVFNKKITITH